jgi:hypothetical protein
MLIAHEVLALCKKKEHDEADDLSTPLCAGGLDWAKIDRLSP